MNEAFRNEQIGNGAAIRDEVLLRDLLTQLKNGNDRVDQPKLLASLDDLRRTLMGGSSMDGNGTGTGRGPIFFTGLVGPALAAAVGIGVALALAALGATALKISLE